LATATTRKGLAARRDPAAFEVFDQKCVLDAWASKAGFKALGLGHEGTGGTLLDFMSDYLGSTPTAVGSFLAQRILAMEQRRQRFHALTAGRRRSG
jgi:exonuclease VII large subunit